MSCRPWRHPVRSTTNVQTQLQLEELPEISRGLSEASEATPPAGDTMTFAPWQGCQKRAFGHATVRLFQGRLLFARVPGVSLPPQPPANFWQASGL